MHRTQSVPNKTLSTSSSFYTDSNLFILHCLIFLVYLNPPMHLKNTAGAQFFMARLVSGSVSSAAKCGSGLLTQME